MFQKLRMSREEEGPIRVRSGAFNDFPEDAKRAIRCGSLDSAVGDEGGSLVSLLSGDDEENRDRDEEKKHASEVIADAMQCLTEREQRIMRSRLGGKTLVETGEREDVTRERIRQIETRAVAAITVYLNTPKELREQYVAARLHAKSLARKSPVARQEMPTRPRCNKLLNRIISIRKRRTRQTGDSVSLVVSAQTSASPIASRVLDAVRAAFAGRR